MRTQLHATSIWLSIWLSWRSVEISIQNLELAHTNRAKFPLTRWFLSVSSGLSPFVWVPTSLGDWSCARINQVRFKCLSTPMRGPNNKPLAFVVHGSHSYELAGFLSIAFLGRLASNGRLLGSLSLINRSFCSKKYNGERLRQCESGAW